MNVRMQFEMPEAKAAQLKEVMEKCGISSQKELFNNALTLFEWAVKQREQGRSISSVDERTLKFRDLSMPVLENVEELETRHS